MTNFDKILRNKLRDYDSPVPSDAWENIQKSLPGKKKRPPFKLYFLGAISITIIALLVGNYFFNSNKKLQSNNVATSQIAKIDLKSNTNVNNFYSFENQDNEVKNFESNEGDNSILNKSEIVGNPTSPSSTNKTNFQPLIEEEKTSFNSINNESSTILNIDNSKDEVGNTNLTLNSSIKSLKIEEQSKAKPIEELLESLYLPYSDRVFGSDHSNIMEYISTTMKRHVTSMPCPTFVRNESRSSIEAYYGSGLTFRNLVAKNIEKEGYLLLRKFTEKPIYSYNVGAAYSTGWENGFELKVGLNYSRITERFTYEDKNVIGMKSFLYYLPEYDDEYNEIGKGKEIEEIVPTPGTLKIVHHNKYEFLDIPLLCQYNINGKNRFSMAVSVGPLINISFSQAGKMLDLLNQVKSIENEEIYKRNIGLSFQGSASLRYAINKKIQFVAEPSLRYIPNSISTINNPIQQNYTVLYLNTGLRYSL